MPIFHSFFLMTIFIFGLFSAGHAVFHKRDPRAALGWVATCLVFLGIGPCLYWLFGVNRIQAHAQRLFRLGLWKHGTQTDKEIQTFRLSPQDPFHSKDYRELLSLSEKVNRLPLMVGNKLTPLFNGEEAYPEMLRAIGQAEKFIYLCSYIFDSDDLGRRFLGALTDALGRGVQVWVLLDAFGDKYSRPLMSGLMKEKGIRVARFLPLSLSWNSLHFNLRNHRKILVVDGREAFTGGMNIRGRHLRNCDDFGKAIQDVHFKMEGPAILELQEIFMEDWHFATRESLPWMGHPHPLLPGDSVCRVVSGGPNEDFEKIHWILLGALSWASRKVQIMTPYFVPDRVLIAALNTASLRGVRVEVILPEKNNLPFVHWATRALILEMLEKGVKIYYQPPPFAHNKLLVVDDSYALIGSSNWDDRSLRLNFELDVEVYDPGFAKPLSARFEETRAVSRAVTSEEIRGESPVIQFRNALWKLFSPYL